MNAYVATRMSIMQQAVRHVLAEWHRGVEANVGALDSLPGLAEQLLGDAVARGAIERAKEGVTPLDADFTVEIDGTQGLVVELLVVAKPDTHSIEKAVDEEVTVPYRQDFKGVRYAVWVDTPDVPQEGEYTLKVGGSSCSGIVKDGVKAQSCLYNL